MIVMGSEVGVQTFPADEIKEKGRLKPGKLLLVDTQLGIIIPDEEIKSQLSRRHPYAIWLKENRISMSEIDVQHRVPSDLGDKYDAYLRLLVIIKKILNISLLQWQTQVVSLFDRWVTIRQFRYYLTNHNVCFLIFANCLPR